MTLKALVFYGENWGPLKESFDAECVHSSEQNPIFLLVPQRKTVVAFLMTSSQTWNQRQTRHCIHEATFSIDFGYYPTPAAPTPLEDEAPFSINSSDMDLQTDLRSLMKLSRHETAFQGIPLSEAEGLIM